MAQDRKLASITEGAYLADVESIASFGSFYLDIASESTLAVPVHGSRIFLSNVCPGKFTQTIPDGIHPAKVADHHRGSIDAIRDTTDESKPMDQTLAYRRSRNWYPGNKIKAGSRLGLSDQIPRSQISNISPQIQLGLPYSADQSQSSLTPASFELGTGGLSRGQTRDFDRLRDNPNLRSSPTSWSKEIDSCIEPPDGGLMAWAHAIAGHLISFNVQGLNMSFGIFQSYYQNVMMPEKTPSQIAWIGSIQVFLVFFMGILVSPMMDKGYFRLCFNGGSAILVAGVVATSFCTQWWQLILIQGIATGIGMGLVFSSGVMVLMSYFSKHMGLATGIAAAGASTGGIVFPFMAEKLIFMAGYAWTVRALALAVLLTLIPANIIAREQPGRKRRGKTTMDWTVFHDLPYLLMAAGLFFAYWGMYFAFYFIISYGQAILHLSPTDAINLLIAMNAANLPGRILPNLISDACIGPLNTIIPATFLAAMLVFIWIGTSTPNALIVVACMYGFAAAGLQSLYSAAIHSFSPDPSKTGIRMALVFTVLSVAGLTGAPLGGILIERSGGSYFYAQLFAGCSILFGGVLLLVARLIKSGWSPQRV